MRLTAPAPPGADLVLLYDGLCGFCNRAVQFILARDHGGRMRFAPLQGEFARALLARRPELSRIDSLILVEHAGRPDRERVTTRSEAVLGIWNYVGGPWRAVNLLRLVPRPVRDWGYDRFARIRRSLFGRFDSCPLPALDVRARFID
ncbi:MAG TPA: DCC1-like thiol-disulfide oxidoreductase family protein [Gemmatimonadaceae bacterium]|nr:DCC1-like thiol-disulfide oxidoreductase family protein [Gemmatimonadaceae bacterium]